MRMWVFLLICGAIAGSGLLGCGSSDGPKLGHVVGTVTLNGEPLSQAMLVFHPTRGRESTAKTDADGRYELTYTPAKKGALIDNHVVRISTRSEFLPREKVPPWYNQKTTLTAAVKPKKNTIDFKLVTRPPAVE